MSLKYSATNGTSVSILSPKTQSPSQKTVITRDQRGPEKNSVLDRARLYWGPPGSSPGLHNTLSQDQANQHSHAEEGGASGVSTPKWGAIDSQWLLRKDKPFLFKGTVSDRPSRWSHTHGQRTLDSVGKGRGRREGSWSSCRVNRIKIQHVTFSRN